MLLVKLYFTPTLLLLSCALWQGSQSAPVTGSYTADCVFYARSLLENITAALIQKNLFSGINCTKQSMELNMKTNTASVCAPKIQNASVCSGFSEPKFHEDLCLTNIGKDLLHYYRFLKVQPDPDSKLGGTVLLSLRELMENCFVWTRGDLATKQAATSRPSTFDERLALCKVLRGFQVRTITINRVIGYMNSGEHTK